MANKGIAYERKLVRELYKEGFVGGRIAGSGGGTKEPKPDIIIGRNGKHFAIELKTSGQDIIHIREEQLDGLVVFAKLFGATPLLCVKFSRLPFVFMSIESVDHNGGQSYYVTRREAINLRNRGVYKLEHYT